MRRLALVPIGLLVATALGVPSTAAAPTSLTASYELGAPSEGSGTAAPAARRKVTLKASPRVVVKGNKVRLKGKVRGGRYAKVTIYQKIVGRSWGVEAVKYANARGKYKHREDITAGSRYYQACAKGACSKKVFVKMVKKTKPTKPTKQPTSLSFGSLSATGVEAGAPFTVNGTGSANLAGQSVFVHAYDANSSTWGAVGSGVVAGDGSFAISASVTTAGKAVPLRLVFNGGKKLKASSADAGTVAVYGWYYFADYTDDGILEPVSGSWDYSGSYNLNTQVFPKSVAEYQYDYDYYGYEYVEFNVNRSCVRLVTTLGIDDSASDTSRKFNAIVKGDAVTKYSKTGIGYANPVPVSVDITNVLRLRVETSQTAGSDGTLVWGDARVLCAF